MSYMETILNVQEGLSFVDGDKDLYKILLDTYVEENKFDPDTFKALIQKKDFEAAAKAVHKTKGASYQIGAKTIGDAAQKLEDLLRSKATPDENLVQDFCDSYQKCLEEVAATTANL